MDVEKAASKGHGFFGLFDWGKSKKSKRRLFTGGGGYSPSQGKQMFSRNQVVTVNLIHFHK